VKILVDVIDFISVTVGVFFKSIVWKKCDLSVQSLPPKKSIKFQDINLIKQVTIRCDFTYKFQ